MEVSLPGPRESHDRQNGTAPAVGQRRPRRPLHRKGERATDRDQRPHDAGKRPQGENRRSCSSEQLTCLIQRIQVGDVAAAHALYAQLEPMLRRVMAPYHPDEELYRNLRGELYVALDRLARQFDETRGVNPFTYFERTLAPAVQTAVDRERRPARRELSLESFEAGADDNGPAQPEERWRQRIDRERGGPGAGFEEQVIVRLTLQRALSRLTERQQEVFALWEAGYHSVEMAEILGIPAGTCRQTLHRALARLRRELKKELE